MIPCSIWRTVVWILLSVAAVDAQTQSRRVLDLTVPQPRTSGEGGIPGYSSRVPLPLALRILDLDAPMYTVGRSFRYEVELTNAGRIPITLPWSSDRRSYWENGGSGAIRASVALRAMQGSTVRELLAVAESYGDPAVPSSVLVLRPGESARIRAALQWRLHGVNMSEYLQRTGGRVNLVATYYIGSAEVLATAPASPVHSVNLRPK